MAKAMIELLTDENKREYFAKKSLERMRFFSEERMLGEYKKLILNLTKNKIVPCD